MATEAVPFAGRKPYWWEGRRPPGLLEEWRDIVRREINRFVRTVAAREGAGGRRVLDAAAGSAFYRYFFPEARYLACDLSLRGDYDYRSLDVVCDVARLPFADGAFDTVLCVEAILHFPYPERVLAEFHRVLAPGGCLALTAPLFAYHELPVEHDFLRFTQHGVRRLVADQGFLVESLESMGGRFAALARHAGAVLDLPAKLVRGQGPIARAAHGALEFATDLVKLPLHAGALALDRRFPDRGKYALGTAVIARKVR